MGLLALGGLFLPSEVELETRKSIAASPEELFVHLNGHDGIRSWWAGFADKPEYADYAAFEVTKLGGPDQGVGARIGFEIGGTETETWEILESEADSRVVYRVDW